MAELRLEQLMNALGSAGKSFYSASKEQFVNFLEEKGSGISI
jgi:hypothetical protein